MHLPIIINRTTQEEILDRIIELESVHGEDKEGHKLISTYALEDLIAYHNRLKTKFEYDYILQKPSDLPPVPQVIITLSLGDTSPVGVGLFSVQLDWTVVLDLGPEETEDDVVIIDQKIGRSDVIPPFYNLLDTVEPEVRTYTDVTLVYGTLYTYRVAASNEAGITPSNTLPVSALGFTMTHGLNAQLVDINATFTGSGNYAISWGTETTSAGSYVAGTNSISNTFTGTTGTAIDYVVFESPQEVTSLRINDALLTGIDLEYLIALESLDIDDNTIIIIPVLPDTLTVLQADNNLITELTISDSLEIVSASENPLSIQHLPGTLSNLEELYLNNLTGTLTTIDVTGSNLNLLEVYNQTIVTSLVLDNTTNTLLTVDGSNSTYNNVSLINSSVNVLSLQDNSLSSLDTSTCIALQSLNCNDNTGMTITFGAWVNTDNVTINLLNTSDVLTILTDLNTISTDTNSNRVINVTGGLPYVLGTDLEADILVDLINNKGWNVDAGVLDVDLTIIA